MIQLLLPDDIRLCGACVRGSSASAIVRWLSFVCRLCRWVVCIDLIIKVCFIGLDQ